MQPALLVTTGYNVHIILVIQATEVQPPEIRIKNIDDWLTRSRRRLVKHARMPHYTFEASWDLGKVIKSGSIVSLGLSPPGHRQRRTMNSWHPGQCCQELCVSGKTVLRHSLPR